jgi:hypothetical protein
MKPVFPVAIAIAALAAPAAAQSVDEAALLRSVRAIGDATAGQRIGAGQAADKIVFLARSSGRIVVTSVAALVPGGDWVDPPAGAIAVLRTRTAASDPADLAYAQRTGLSVFIVSEAASPPAILEISRQGNSIRLREIDARGLPAPWRAPAG